MTPTQCSGIELRTFLNDEKIWVNERYYEDAVFTVDGYEVENPEVISATAIVTVKGGVLFERDLVVADFDTTLSNWLRGQNHTTLVIEVPKTKRSQIERAVRRLGGRIVK